MSDSSSTSELLNSLLTAYQYAEKVHGQTVSDLVAAEIRRDEALQVKNEAFAKLEQAREKIHNAPAPNVPTPAKMREPPPSPRSPAPKILTKNSMKRKSSNGIVVQSVPKQEEKKQEEKEPDEKIQEEKKEDIQKPDEPKRTPLKRTNSRSSGGSRRSVGGRRGSKAHVPAVLEDAEINKPVFEICNGRTREWFDQHIDCDSLGLVKNFFRASFGTQTNAQSKKVTVLAMVLNDEWNDLAVDTTEIQEVYIGQNNYTSPSPKPSLRDKAAEALVIPPQKEPLALFFAPKISKKTSEIYYVGHWQVQDGKMLSPPVSKKGQMRQALAKFKFVGIDKRIVDAINEDK
jgi:hypothetical protein